MRRPLRWLASVAIFVVLLYRLRTSAVYHLDQLGSSSPSSGDHDIFQFYNSAPSTTDHNADPDASSSAAVGAPPSTPPKDIGAFWQKWSRIMYESRPTSPAISLLGQATTMAPTADGPREPYSNLLRETQEHLDVLRDAHGRFVRSLADIQQHSDDSDGEGDGDRIFSGRGVVIIGGGEYFGPAIISIHMLRRAGSTLPVEVFVPSDDDYEADLCDVYLPKLGAKCVVLAHLLARGRPELRISHFQLKAPAVLLSSFAEVLLLDSDSIPLVDPAKAIFQVEPYKSKGLIVWPDFWAATESPKFWTIAGLDQFPAGLPSTSSEAGQLVINKKTHLAVLLLATYYNVFGKDHYYPLLSQGALGQGDKETFMAAAVVLGLPYYRVKTPVAAVGRYDGSQHKGTAMVQHLPSQDLKHSKGLNVTVHPAFLHSNTPKMNAGHLVDEGDLLSVDGKTRLRLLGSKAKQLATFAFDVESTIWDLLVQTGCDLADTLREWKHREGLCARLREHHNLLFGED